MVRTVRYGHLRAAVSALVVVVAVVTLGGCSMVQQMTWEKFPEDPVLVPIAEKEELGYDQPSTVSNGQLQAGALENAEQTYAVVRPQIEAAIGRQVEMTGIRAIYPDGAAQVSFRTLDEPVVGFDTTVALRADGSVSPTARIETIEGFERRTVNALYRMAYREQFTQMREYLLTTYPQFTTLPDGYLRAHRLDEALFGTGFRSGLGDQALADRAAEDAIYRAYQEDPDRTDAEWQTIFEQEASDRLVEIGIRLVLTDPQADLTSETMKQIALDMRDNPLFTQFSSWSVITYSNLVVRDRDYFHEQWGITVEKNATDESDWDINHEINGASA